MNPSDDSNDPLMNDIGINEENDVNFLDISRYSDDDDVELLGVMTRMGVSMDRGKGSD